MTDPKDVKHPFAGIVSLLATPSDKRTLVRQACAQLPVPRSRSNGCGAGRKSVIVYCKYESESHLTATGLHYYYNQDPRDTQKGPDRPGY